MARVMASELAPRGIRVNVVAPGGGEDADLEWCCADRRGLRRARRAHLAQHSLGTAR